MEPEGSLLCSKQPVNFPNDEPDQSSESPHTISCISIAVFSPPSTTRPSNWPASRPKPCIHFCPPYVPHVLAISFWLAVSPDQYVLKRKDHKAPHYAISRSPLLPLPS